MQKEYGGFIELEHYHGDMLHKDGIKLNSAQNCLRYLIRKWHIKTIWLPYFLCDSVPGGCHKENIEVKYYHIDENLRPVFPENAAQEDWMYIVNYYGQLHDQELLAYKEKFDNLILDNVQAYYHKPEADIPAIYSCRKFFGVADGGIITGVRDSDGGYEKDYSYGRMEFLMGRFEKGANPFYGQYVENNELVGELDIMEMSSLTENLLRSLDYDRIRKVREENFIFLHDVLGEVNALNIHCPKAPFMYPLYVGNGPAVRKQLIANRIYVPRLWPLEYHSDSIPVEQRLSDNILPIPCDQRYGKDDMKYITEVILNSLSV